PATFPGDLSCRSEDPFDGRDFVVSAPYGVDREHRPRRSEIDELDAAGKLLDEGADDEADPAALRNVAPNRRSGATPVDPGLEPRGATRRDDGVVVAGRHLARPQLQRFIAHARKLDLLAVGKAMALCHGEANDLASDCPLGEVVGIRRQRREREIAGSAPEESRNIAAEDLASVNLEQRVVLAETGEQDRDGLEGTDERVGQPYRSCLSTCGGLHPLGGSVGPGQDAPAVGQKHLTLGSQGHASRAALEQGDAEQLLERPDLLADRLLSDVKLLWGAG